MTITIKLKTDNTAFEDKETETRRIVQDWLDHTFGLNRLRGACTDNLLDFNGNTVGSVTVTGK